VATASDKVKSQSDAVIAVADIERQAVEQTATDLTAAAETMRQIAQLAQTCNATPKPPSRPPKRRCKRDQHGQRHQHYRDTIRETEKRIKRLGERSQEISGVVNLINTIAERTTSWR